MSERARRRTRSIQRYVDTMTAWVCMSAIGRACMDKRNTFTTHELARVDAHEHVIEERASWGTW